MNKIELFVHCSYTKPDQDIDAETIRGWHVNERGWRDIGYNAVITRKPELQAGRDLDQDGDFLEEIGAHVRGHNTHSIGVCLVGGMDYDGHADFNFTRGQMRLLEIFINDCFKRYPNLIVRGHRDVDPDKACPCFNVQEWWYG